MMWESHVNGHLKCNTIAHYCTIIYCLVITHNLKEIIWRLIIIMLKHCQSYVNLYFKLITKDTLHVTGAQFRPNHWYMGHSPCVYFQLFTLSQGEKAILDRSARCAISGFLSIMEHKHHTKVCTETLSILISIHFTSKFEESQRNWWFYSRHNNAARWSLTHGRSL